MIAAAMITMAACHSSSTWACSCLEIPPEAAFNRADEVFAGIVTGVRQVRWRPGSPAVLTEYRFRVTHRWKGKKSRTIRTRSGEPCGYQFRRGQHYLVFATYHKGQLSTGGCSRNALLRHAMLDRMLFAEPARVGAARALPIPRVEDLLDSLSSSDLATQTSATRALVHDQRVLPLLASILRGQRSGNPAAMLGGVRRSKAVLRSLEPDLLWALHHGREARRETLRSLAVVMNRPDWLHELLYALHEEDLELLREAVQLSDPLEGDPSVLRERLASRLWELLSHPDGDVRAYSIYALGGGYPEREAELVSLLRRRAVSDSHYFARYAAEYQLQLIEERPKKR